MIKKIWSKFFPPNPNIKKLQDALGITDKEAKETDALIRSTIGPLEDDIVSITKRVSKLIQRYTSSLPEDESALICYELVSYYMKRDKDWMNGENTFCVLAYVFTFFSFIIDSIDTFDLLERVLCNFSNEPHVISSAIFLLALLSLLGGILITAKIRKTEGFPAWFTLANKFLPTLTMLAYLGYYGLKHRYMLGCNNDYFIQTVEKPLFCVKQGRGSLRIAGKVTKLC